MNYKNKNISNIEFVKIQIENIFKYIYHESEKNKLTFICNSLKRFCNENRIVLIEERSRRSNQSRYNFINKRFLNEDIPTEISENGESKEINAITMRKKLKEKIKSEIKNEGQYLNYKLKYNKTIIFCIIDDFENLKQDYEEEANIDLIGIRKSNRKITEKTINSLIYVDSMSNSINGKNDTSIYKKTEKFLKIKRLREHNDSENEKIKIRENNTQEKKKASEKKTSNKKLKNKTTKRLNFGETDDTSDFEFRNNKSIKNKSININTLNEKIVKNIIFYK